MIQTAVIYAFHQEKIVEYISRIESGFNHKRDYNTIGLLQKKNKPGELSKNSQRNIEKKLTSWLTAIEVYNLIHTEIKKRDKRKPIFVTLTLSQKTELNDVEIKDRLLHLFIKKIKYQYNVKETFWKAERQKNGNIHFHLVLDHYIPYKKIQTTWNALQKKEGLIENYIKKYNKTNPPSTHVRSIESLDRSIGYVMKYVSKKNTKKKIKGNVYRFSENISQLKLFTYDSTQDFHEGFQQYLHNNVVQHYSGEYFAVLNFAKKIQSGQMPAWLRDRYFSYYLKVYENLYVA